MTDILVTGGTGTLGRALVPRLPGAHVLSRTRGDRRGDLTTGEGLDAALEGVTTVVHLASSPRGDAAATERLIAATAPDAHLVHMSIVGVDRVPLGYYREKLRTEELVAGSGRPWTILRATQFPQLLAGLFGTLARSGLLPVPAGTSFQPVAVDDVAARLAALVAAGPSGRVTDLGGPEVVPTADLARTWLRLTGRRRAVLPVRVPGAIARAYREGHHLTPDHAEGTITFAEALR